MRSLLITVFVVFVAMSGLFFVVGRLSQERESLRREYGPGGILPSSVTKIVSLDLKGIVSDVIFFKGLMYYGGKIMHSDMLSEDEWNWFYESMQVATDLDPYFYDPYYLGAINLAWQANDIRRANTLLEKAFGFRTWDWTIPFHLGFNNFYFERNNEKAAYYLREATKRPGGSGGIVPMLAARLTLEGGRTETAVAFLEDVIKKTDHERTRNLYLERLHALKGVLYLERAVQIYRKKYGRQPLHLDELVKRRIIKEIPHDPYLGTFYITSDGAIKSTSNFTWAGKREALGH